MIDHYSNHCESFITLDNFNFEEKQEEITIFMDFLSTKKSY